MKILRKFYSIYSSTLSENRNFIDKNYVSHAAYNSKTFKLIKLFLEYFTKIIFAHIDTFNSLFVSN